MATLVTLNSFLLDIRLFGWLRVYPAAPHIDARRHALAEALREMDADVVCLQEAFRRPHRRALAEAVREAYPHAAGIKQPGLPVGTGLMVLSRHPITDARFREFRAAVPEERIAVRMGMLVCRVDLPDLGPTRIVDFHLSAGGLRHHPEAPEAEALRDRQIAELIEAADAPGTERVILAGDLNSGPHTSRVNYRRVRDAGFRDPFEEGVPAGARVHT